MEYQKIIFSILLKTKSSKGNSWSDGVSHQTSTPSELWGTPLPNKQVRGPPPGLSANNKTNIAPNAITSTSTSGNSANGWMSGSLTSRIGVGSNNWNNNGSWPSPWLLLKNLTTQACISFYLRKFITSILFARILVWIIFYIFQLLFDHIYFYFIFYYFHND